jgi:hypothetical protein
MSRIPDGFANLGRQMGDARLRLEPGPDDGVPKEVKVQGEQRWNPFARFSDWKKRTPDDIKANQAVAQQLVNGIRAKYGDRIANMANRELRSQVREGRPLTMHRYQQVMKQADREARFLQARNQSQLNRGMERLYKEVMFEVAGRLPSTTRQGEFDAFEDKKECLDLIRKTVTSDPEFEKKHFDTAQDMVDHFKGKASQAMRQAHLETCMPYSTQLESRPDPARFGGALDLCKDVANQLTQRTGIPPKPEFIGGCLDLYARTGDQIATLENMEVVSDAELDQRDALLKDLKWLNHTLAGHIGLYDAPTIEMFDQTQRFGVEVEKMNGIPEHARQLVMKAHEEGKNAHDAIRGNDQPWTFTGAFPACRTTGRS